MAKLGGLVIAAKEPNRLAEFYREVFELRTVSRDSPEITLSDGSFTLILRKNRDGQTPGLHAARFHVEDLKALRSREIRNTLPSSFESELADPDGNLIEVHEMEFNALGEPSPFPIRHIAVYTPNPRRLADFYTGIFKMREVAYSDRSSIFVSDGYFNLALLFERPGEEKPGLNHFGFYVKDIEEMRERAEKAGVPRGDKRPDRIPYAEYRLHDPEGNGIDISVKGWKA